MHCDCCGQEFAPAREAHTAVLFVNVAIVFAGHTEMHCPSNKTLLGGQVRQLLAELEEQVLHVE
jgi:hypothetical protein